MPRKTYTREFKLQALKMLTDQGLSVAEVARRLGVTEGSVRAWREAAGEHGAAAFPGHGNSTPDDDELRRLRAENTRLRAERDLLKKAAAYFASPPSCRSPGCATPWPCPSPGITPGPHAHRPRARPGGAGWSRRSR